jgi:SNARE associated Golgi protein
MLDRFYRFFTEMDSSASKAVWIAFGLFTVAGAVLAAGMLLIDLDQSGIASFLRGLRDVWWAPLAVTGTFVTLAFIGAPQVVLIAATVAVFGPAEGVVLSWVATLVSGTIGYVLGRVGGAAALSKLLGGRGGRALGFIGKNGFLASLVIRLVPSGPFIICNMDRDRDFAENRTGGVRCARDWRSSKWREPRRDCIFCGRSCDLGANCVCCAANVGQWKRILAF